MKLVANFIPWFLYIPLPPGTKLKTWWVSIFSMDGVATCKCNIRPLKMGPTGRTETPEKYQSTLRNVPDDRRPLCVDTRPLTYDLTWHNKPTPLLASHTTRNFIETISCDINEIYGWVVTTTVSCVYLKRGQQQQCDWWLETAYCCCR